MPDKQSTIRVAALADIHVRENSGGALRALFRDISEECDLLVLAGDLTNRGLPEEAVVLAEEIRTSCRLPVLAVLGNHDCECGHEEAVARILTDAGVHMLEDEPKELLGIGFAGVKGFCGGFDRHALAPWGEDMIKKFVRETLDETLRLESSLAKIRTDHRVVVLHYAPVRDTVQGEPPEIFPFLGSSRLAEPIDRFGASAVVHGHAHNGSHKGKTMSDVPVYNVAMAIMQRVRPNRPYLVLTF